MCVGAACPCISTPRGPRLSLAGCPRLVRTYGCACPPRTRRLREEGRAGVGEYTLSYPPFSLQRQRRAEWGGGRSAAPTRKPERALVRSGAGLPLPPWPVPSLTLGGGEHRPKAVALAVLPHCRLQRGLGVGSTTWRRARVTVSMVTMVLLRTDPPPPCLAQRAPCRGGPAGSVSGSGGGGEAVTDGHSGRAPLGRPGTLRARCSPPCSQRAEGTERCRARQRCCNWWRV